MREKLIEVMEDTRANAAWHRWGFEESADYLIKNDVVPVVRCKDCKHWWLTRDGDHGCDYVDNFYAYGFRTNADDFCSCGERKDNET